MKKNKKLKEMRAEPVSYALIAGQAALFERYNNARAVDFWIQASKIARNSDNQEWAENRAAFCERWIRKDVEITANVADKSKDALKS